MKATWFFPVVLSIVTLIGCSEAENVPSDQQAASSAKPAPHLERQGNASRLIVEGRPFLLIAGELHNSTTGGFKYMRPVWKKMAGKNLNSVIAAVSWELIEREEGKFDFSYVDSMIMGAREANLKLVLIWFGSWKNSGSVYIPSWMKKDFVKYPRVKDEQGKPLEILSTFGTLSAEKDATAFGALMHHLKETDGVRQTVVMMQVENEAGILDNMGRHPGNARRDFSDPANEAYKGPVPVELTDYLVKNKDKLFPELYKVWSENGFKTSGSWESVFGKSKVKSGPGDWKFYSWYTEEIFMAWNYARYIGRVAENGKKEYALPMYVNAWLKQPLTYLPGKYPSGGPLPQVLDIWRAAAPSIDFIAPDIYTEEFIWTCQEFTRSNNPLFIPETRGGKTGAARAFYVFGEYSAGCFAPFGIDNAEYAENDPLDKSYAVLQKIAPFILENQGKSTMKGILVDSKNPIQLIGLGNYSIEIKLDRTGNNDIGGGLIIQTGLNEFICSGSGFDLYFSPNNDSMRLGLDAVDEGTFEDGQWVPERRLNGDETHASTYDGTGLKFPPDKVNIQKASLYHYK